MDCQTSIEAAMDSAIWTSQAAQLELHTDEEEQFIQQEVARKLWQPMLPNAGPAERGYVRRLRLLSRDESLVVTLKAAAGRYADALARCLPMQECIRKGKKWVTLPGCYYKRRPVTGRTDPALATAAKELLLEATAKKDRVKKWFAKYILDGPAVAVSNFRMDCLYLLRGPEGVTRLVRLMNTKGEVSKGDQIGGADILPNEMGSGAEKFREFVQTAGNFTWGCEGGAGNTELQLLQLDVTEETAYREVKLIEYCGWHELQVTGPRIVVPGKEILHGFWICAEGILTEPAEGETVGKIEPPDEDGVNWYEGEGYAMSRKGRELDFIQGRPRLRPELAIEQVKFDISDWEQPASDTQTTPSSSELYATNPMGAFFREVCLRFNDTVGGSEGYLAVGSVLGYAAAPEIYAKQKNFPSSWVSGQMGSGKSTFCSWLVALQGLSVPMGMGLTSKNVTAVGIACQLENYSNILLWLDEFRQHQIAADKEPMLRDCYGRQLAGKWTPDGKQRVIRTMTLVSGESTTSDAATRSRYPHVLISEQKRLANHYEWMQNHQEFFFFFFRELLYRRAEFVGLVMEETETWMNDPALKKVPSREKVTHSVCYAAFAAAARLLGSHSAEEITAYRRFIAAHATRAAADVASDVNVNVFIQDLIVAYDEGEISNDCFKVESVRMDHPPGSPNQGPWTAYTLYVNFHQALSALGIYLRKGNLNLTLRAKDLRDQLSRNDFFIKLDKENNYQILKKFGATGKQANQSAWGFVVDKHPLGTRQVSDEEYELALLPERDRKLDAIGQVFRESDPRKGPLFSIVEGWLEAKEKERRENS